MVLAPVLTKPTSPPACDGASGNEVADGGSLNGAEGRGTLCRVVVDADIHRVAIAVEGTRERIISRARNGGNVDVVGQLDDTRLVSVEVLAEP